METQEDKPKRRHETRPDNDHVILRRHPFRSPLKPKQIAALKLKLCIPATAPLPLCPCKVNKVIKALEAQGDYSHSNYGPPDADGERERIRYRKTHTPCPVCGCKQIAGWGTRHYGWGLCQRHERKKGYDRIKDKIAAAHLEAMQQHHPRFYWEAHEVYDEIEKKGKAAEGAYDLQDDLIAVQGLMRVFVSSLSEHDKNVRDPQPIIKSIDALTEAIKDKNSIPEQEWLEIGQSLDYIKTRLVCPLTERTQYGIVEMCDATKIKLASQTLVNFTRSAKTVFDIVKEKWISDINFDKWFAGLMRTYDRKFGEATYQTDKGDERITEIIAECVREAGDPRRG